MVKNIKSVAVSIAAGAMLMLAPGTAFADKGNNGNDNEHNSVTICHATGNGGYVIIHPNANGVVNGHYDHQDARDIIPSFTYNDHGTTKTFPGQNLSNGGQAILDNDCVVPEGGQGGGPTDICVNIEGVQTEVPAGMVRDANGNCNNPSNGGTDICVNIEGVQTEVPSGMVRDSQGNCTTPGAGGGGTTTTTTGQVLGTSTTATGGQGAGPQVAAVPQGSVNGGLGAASKTVNHVSLAGLVGALLSVGSGLVMLNRRQS